MKRRVRIDRLGIRIRGTLAGDRAALRAAIARSLAAQAELAPASEQIASAVGDAIIAEERG